MRPPLGPGLALGLLLLTTPARAADRPEDAPSERARAERTAARRTRAIWAGLAVATLALALLGRALGRAQRARDRERRRSTDARARELLGHAGAPHRLEVDPRPDAPPPADLLEDEDEASPPDPAATGEAAALLAAVAADPAAAARWAGVAVRGEGRATFTSAVLGRDPDLGVEGGVRLTVEVEVPGGGPFPPRVVLHLAAAPDPAPGFHEVVRFTGVVHGYQDASRTLLVVAGALAR